MKSNLLDLILFLYNSTYTYLIFLLIFDQRDVFQFYKSTDWHRMYICVCVYVVSMSYRFCYSFYSQIMSCSWHLKKKRIVICNSYLIIGIKKSKIILQLIINNYNSYSMCMLQNSNYHNHSFNPEKKASIPQTNPHFLSVIFGFLSLSLSLSESEKRKEKKKVVLQVSRRLGIKGEGNPSCPWSLSLSLSFFTDNPTKD